MSREIKFRAWDGKRMLKAHTINDFVWMACCGGGDSDASPYTDTQFMQFTGLKDKNGKEIYEGDILKSTPGWATFFIDDKREHISVVEFVGSGFKGNYSGTLYNLDRLDMAYTEVIGNIYENP